MSAKHIDFYQSRYLKARDELTDIVKERELLLSEKDELLEEIDLINGEIEFLDCRISTCKRDIEDYLEKGDYYKKRNENNQTKKTI